MVTGILHAMVLNAVGFCASALHGMRRPSYELMMPHWRKPLPCTNSPISSLIRRVSVARMEGLAVVPGSPFELELFNCALLSHACYEESPVDFLDAHGAHHLVTDVIAGAYPCEMFKGGATSKVLAKTASVANIVPAAVSQKFLLASRTLENGQVTKYVAFCGTENWIDWLSNFNASAVNSFQGNFHAGFYDRAAPFPLAWCCDWIKKGANLVITGHSLGAAIASIVTVHLLTEHILRSEDRKRVLCVTFAQPMVLNAQLAALLHWHGLGPNFHQVVLKDDPVPKLFDVASSARAFLAQVSSNAQQNESSKVAMETAEKAIAPLFSKIAQLTPPWMDFFTKMGLSAGTAALNQFVMTFHFFGAYHVLSEHNELSGFDESVSYHQEIRTWEHRGESHARQFLKPDVMREVTDPINSWRQHSMKRYLFVLVAVFSNVFNQPRDRVAVVPAPLPPLEAFGAKVLSASTSRVIIEISGQDACFITSVRALVAPKPKAEKGEQKTDIKAEIKMISSTRMKATLADIQGCEVQEDTLPLLISDAFEQRHTLKVALPLELVQVSRSSGPPSPAPSSGLLAGIFSSKQSQEASS